MIIKLVSIMLWNLWFFLINVLLLVELVELFVNYMYLLFGFKIEFIEINSVCKLSMFCFRLRIKFIKIWRR